MALSFFLSTHSNNSTIDTANSLNNFNSNNTETAGSVAVMFGSAINEDCGMDAFGGKDLFGNPDLSNMDAGLFASAGNTDNSEAAGSIAYGAETAGSVACADGGAGASVGAGADCGSCGGGGFISVC